ncbi:NAD(P)/FAD-dependent oxidoreductase [Mucilaginibacter antarcticus]|uniref:Ferredoxin--NADP reductase n=1 Tax=Mucilaginibacter antarcticus TaxID=1855725 RepID=A0ABW5XSG9_9SPHI
MEDKIVTDLCIIGAGPVGLFAVFEAGLLKMRCHLIDVLPQVGGQLSEIYPQKPIYDIPGFPVINAQALVENLMEQIAPFKPTFSLGERVEQVIRLDGDTFLVKTNEGTTVEAKAIVIAAGLGCFEPRKPAIEGLVEYEGKGVNYFVKNPEVYRDKDILIAGGGDSALDWTIFLSDIARKVTLVHRSDSFRGAPDSVEKVSTLANAGKIDLVLQSNVTALEGLGHLQQVQIAHNDTTISKTKADFFIPLFGLTPKLGPIAEWGLNLNGGAIEVNTVDYSTNVPGIYAIGDINTYPGKLKLILCGFHEAALMAQTAYHRVYPDKKLTFKYTTVYGVNQF